MSAQCIRLGFGFFEIEIDFLKYINRGVFLLFSFDFDCDPDFDLDYPNKQKPSWERKMSRIETSEPGHLCNKRWPASPLEIKDLRFSSQIDKMRAAFQNHVGEKLCLVNLTILGTGDSDPDRDVILHEIGQIIVRAISGFRLLIKISA